MSGGTVRKVTYSLPEELVRELEGAVREGAASSYSAFVAGAVAERLRRHREERLASAFAEAGSDPLFLEDVEEAMQDFAAADADQHREEP